MVEIPSENNEDAPVELMKFGGCRSGPSKGIEQEPSGRNAGRPISRRMSHAEGTILIDVDAILACVSHQSTDARVDSAERLSRG